MPQRPCAASQLPDGANGLHESLPFAARGRRAPCSRCPSPAALPCAGVQSSSRRSAIAAREYLSGVDVLECQALEELNGRLVIFAEVDFSDLEVLLLDLA